MTLTNINTLNLIFWWPCISIHPCNENQLDALFILSLFHELTSTCFGHICSASSGSILYIHRKWYVLCCTVDSLLAFHPNPANGQSTVQHDTFQLLYIYGIPPADGLQICQKHVHVDWRNKLRLNLFQMKPTRCTLLLIIQGRPKVGIQYIV